MTPSDIFSATVSITAFNIASLSKFSVSLPTIYDNYFLAPLISSLIRYLITFNPSILRTFADIQK